MDDGSEAETAASLHTMSDAAQTVNSATFTDPNSVYPHPQSLRSPIGIARERNPEEDVAIQYVTAKAGELRKPKNFHKYKIFCAFSPWPPVNIRAITGRSWGSWADHGR